MKRLHSHKFTATLNGFPYMLRGSFGILQGHSLSHYWESNKSVKQIDVIIEADPKHYTRSYHILPIKGTSPNKGAPSLEGPNVIINGQNRRSFFNIYPIFNLKPPFESWDPQLFPQSIRPDLARAPGALIRQITVIEDQLVGSFQ